MLTKGAKISHVGVLFQMNFVMLTSGRGREARKNMFFHSYLKIPIKSLLGTLYLGAETWQWWLEGRSLTKDMLPTPP